MNNTLRMDNNFNMGIIKSEEIVCFNHFKTACIIHGVYARYMQGQKSAEGVDLDYYRSRIGTCIEMSKRAAEEFS